MDLDDFDDDEVSPWIRRGASRQSAPGTVLLSKRNDSMDKRDELFGRHQVVPPQLRTYWASGKPRPIHLTQFLISKVLALRPSGRDATPRMSSKE